METDFIYEYGLLVAGLAILAVAIVALLVQQLKRTPRGRLNQQRRDMQQKRIELVRVRKSHDKAKAELAKLKAKAKKVKPRRMQEAEENFLDQATLLRHAIDAARTAENHVRNIILKEYPPIRQERMLARYLPDRSAGGSQ